MAFCAQQSDCRAGYVCADIKSAPWSARVLDDDQSRSVCIPPPDQATSGTPDDPNAPVCRAAAPSVPPISVSDAGIVDSAAVHDSAINDAGTRDASDAADAAD